MRVHDRQDAVGPRFSIRPAGYTRGFDDVVYKTVRL